MSWERDVVHSIRIKYIRNSPETGSFNSDRNPLIFEYPEVLKMVLCGPINWVEQGMETAYTATMVRSLSSSTLARFIGRPSSRIPITAFLWHRLVLGRSVRCRS
jgi:hypothetical protein